MNRSPPPSRRRSFLLLAATLGSTSVAGEAHAQGDAQGAAAAMALYDQALAAMDARDYAAACPKIEEALRIEPSAVGARLTLGECYEGAGRIASAWAAFVRAEQAATQASQAARQAKAHERAEALRPRLSQLRVVVPEEAYTLRSYTIWRDGVPAGDRQWGAPIPVDKGTHTIVVKAAGKQPYEQRVAIDGEGVESVLTIPPLRDVPVPPPQPASPLHQPSDDDGVSMAADERGVVLYKVTGQFTGVHGDGVSFAPVCELPCSPSRRAMAGQELFFGGPNVARSSHFSVGEVSPGQRVQVTAGDKAKYFWGAALTVLGGGTALGGTALGIVATDHGGPSGVVSAGVGLGIGGAVALIGGIVLWVSGTTTHTFVGGAQSGVRF